jgi:hypothetical protein
MKSETGTNMQNSTMNRFQARELDKKGSYYAAYDEESALWCVFGSESGFCYFTYMSESWANKMAANLNFENENNNNP